MIDEGYVKYQCHWSDKPTVTSAEITELNQWRDRLYQLNFIGQYDNGIGFGNISIRDEQPEYFIISGTQTGGIPHLTEKHYTKVTEFDWEKNLVTCVGSIQASSEALTHAALYVANPEIRAVIHVHHLSLWQALLNKVPTTDINCAYGTPEMAQEIMRLCQENITNKLKIIVMSGHKEGIITFGKNLTEAGDILLNYSQKNI
ncbi:MAG: class II aldolase/adducin family protein [Xenococcaceae cyanobacterium]